MKTDYEISKQFEKHKKASEQGLSQQRKNIEEDYRYFAGDKRLYAWRRTTSDRGGIVVFNRIQPLIAAVLGFTIQQRKRAQYVPFVQQNLLAMYSEGLNSYRDSMRAACGAEHYETRQDSDMYICGLGFTDVALSFEEKADRTPDGEYIMERVHPLEVLYDPNANDTNLKDSRWFIRTKNYEREEALQIFPGTTLDDFEPAKPQLTAYEWYPFGGVVDKIAWDIGDNTEGMVAVHSYQWYERQTYYRAMNPALMFDGIKRQAIMDTMRRIKEVREAEAAEEDNYTPEDAFTLNVEDEQIVCTPEIKDDLMEMFATIGIPVEFVEGTRICYYTAIMSKDKVLRKFKSIDQTGFTIKCKTGYRDEQYNTWFGMVALLKEPQRYLNKSLTEMLYVIASNSKGGVLYEKSAVDDPVKFERQYASTSSAVQIRDGATGKITPKASAALPSGYENIFAISENNLMSVLGINPEFLGNSENKQVSGVLERQRIKQVTSTLAPYFDSISMYDRSRAISDLSYIRMLVSISPRRTRRVLGDGSTQFITLTKAMIADTYDIDVHESSDTATMQDEKLTMLKAIADSVAPLGINLYPFVIKQMPLKQTEIQEMIAAMQPQQDPEAAMLSKATQQMLIEQQKADVARTVADAEYKRAQIKREQAQAMKTFSEGQQVNLENEAIVTSNPNVSITI